MKALGRTEPVELTPGGYTPWYDWGLLRNRYREALPDTVFYPLEFDNLRRSGNLLRRWKAELGCTTDTVDTLPGSDVVNRSLPGELVEICRFANQRGDRDLVEWAIQVANITNA